MSSQLLIPGPLYRHGSLCVPVQATGEVMQIEAWGDEWKSSKVLKRRRFKTFKVRPNELGVGFLNLDGREISRDLERFGSQSDHFYLSYRNEFQCIEVCHQPSLQFTKHEFDPRPKWSWKIVEIGNGKIEINLLYQNLPIEGRYQLGLYDRTKRVLLKRTSVLFEDGKGKMTLNRSRPECVRFILLDHISESVLDFYDYQKDSKVEITNLCYNVTCGIDERIELDLKRDQSYVIWSLAPKGIPCPFEYQLSHRGEKCDWIDVDIKHKAPRAYQSPHHFRAFQLQKCKDRKLALYFSADMDPMEYILFYKELNGNSSIYSLDLKVNLPTQTIIRPYHRDHHSSLDQVILPPEGLGTIDQLMEPNHISTLRNGFLQIHGRLKDDCYENDHEILNSTSSQKKEVLDEEPPLPPKGLSNSVMWKFHDDAKSPMGKMCSWGQFIATMAIRLLKYPMWCSLQTTYKVSALEEAMKYRSELSDDQIKLLEENLSYGKRRLKAFMKLGNFGLFGPSDSNETSKMVFDLMMAGGLLNSDIKKDIIKWAKKSKFQKPQPIHKEEINRLNLRSTETIMRVLLSSTSIAEQWFRSLKEKSKYLEFQGNHKDGFLDLLLKDDHRFDGKEVTIQKKYWIQKKNVWWKELIGIAGPKIKKERSVSLGVPSVHSPGEYIPIDWTIHFLQFIKLTHKLNLKPSMKIDLLEFDSKDDEYDYLSIAHNYALGKRRELKEARLSRDIKGFIEKGKKVKCGQVFILHLQNSGDLQNNVVELDVPPHVECLKDINTTIVKNGSKSIIPLESKYQRVVFRAKGLGKVNFNAKGMDFNDLSVTKDLSLDAFDVVTFN